MWWMIRFLRAGVKCFARVGGRSGSPEYELHVLRQDPDADIALCYINHDGPQSLEYLSCAGTDVDRAEVAIHAYGFSDQGMITADGSMFPSVWRNGWFWRTDATVAKGFSGGPVTDSAGKLVAIVSRGFTDRQGQNYVTPITMAEGMLSSIGIEIDDPPTIVHVWQQEPTRHDGGGAISTGPMRVERTLNRMEPADEQVGWLRFVDSTRLEIQPGRYLITASAPAAGVRRHVLALEDSAGVVLCSGTTAYSSEGDNQETRATLCGQFEIQETSRISLAHRVEFRQAGMPWQLGHSNSVFTQLPSVYAEATITKLR